MKSNKKTAKSNNQQLRLLPGILLASLQWVLWFLIPKFASGGTSMVISIFGGLIIGVAIVVWWAFFSRAARSERWIAVILMFAALAIIPRFTHESIVTGLSGLMFYVYAIPVLCISFVIWAIISRGLSKTLQRATMIMTILLASGFWLLVRSEGIAGDASAEFSWRWAKTHEEKLLNQAEETTSKPTEIKESAASWSGFRGPDRDSKVYGIKIKTDWKTSPPVELWRKAIGPGCSSFAIMGSVFYTQEQRGDDEVVSCYDLTTGEPIWKHHDKARFWDSHAGAGPRSTPTIHDSLIFTLGATGILNVLSLDDGQLLWSRNAATDLQDTIPGWGYASSPLVLDSIVIVAISGTLIAYDKVSGEALWQGPKGGENYSSPHLIKLDGIQQVLMMSQVAASSFAPEDGQILWEYPWEAGAIIQPAITAKGDLLISEGYKKAVHRIHVSHDSGNWTLEKKWSTTKIRPDFNDFIVHKDHIYGFEGFSITCIDLKDGSRKWKNGRYGGQLLLIADQDLLLVLTEKGELVLVEATPDHFKELAKIPAIEGKTWNHPALAEDILLVRNTQEMTAFRLPLAK